MKRKTMVFGLTGNIGTGKSTVAWMFGELGVPALDADELAHEALSPRSAAWKAVYERYGRSVFLSDDVVDRQKLAEIVFKNQAERKFLESVIHPHVKDQIGHRVAEFAREEKPFVIVEVPLLYEAGWEGEFDSVIVVRCDQEREIERCREKFGFSREETLLRLAAQYPLSRKVAAADAVIDNDGALEETRVQVQRLHQDMVKGKFPR
ncbi:MAG: dephospho-CoA kinase [Pseudomonadota bacterium]